MHYNYNNSSLIGYNFLNRYFKTNNDKILKIKILIQIYIYTYLYAVIITYRREGVLKFSFCCRKKKKWIWSLYLHI